LLNEIEFGAKKTGELAALPASRKVPSGEGLASQLFLIVAAGIVIAWLEAVGVEVPAETVKVPIGRFTGTSRVEVVELTGMVSSWINLPLRSRSLTTTDTCSEPTGGALSFSVNMLLLEELLGLIEIPETLAVGGVGGAADPGDEDGGGVAATGVAETAFEAVPPPAEFRARIFTG
jgi:hypothetical protein